VSDKPSYLGLLNAIAVGEGRAHTYLRAWAETTSDPDVKRAIETVAIREGEHALAFEKRICELGYSLRQRDDDDDLEKTVAIARSDRSDLEKFEKLGLGGGGGGGGADPFTKMFEDTSIDVQTGELLGRYIAEERDSGRILGGCYHALREAAGDAGEDSPSGEFRADLRALLQRSEDVTASLRELRERVAELRD